MADGLCRGAPAAAKPAKPKAKAVIQIWMWGGPAHLDTFDPKPEAGNDYCGPLNNPIKTNVDGIVIGELLPMLAKQADNPFYRTLYGQKYLYLRKQVGMGALSV